MSLRCLDNFMHYSKSASQIYDFEGVPGGYKKLGNTDRYYGPKIAPNGNLSIEGGNMMRENFTNFDKYGVSAMYKCGPCDNRVALCNKPSGQPCPTGMNPTPFQYRYWEPVRPLKEDYVDLKNFHVKLITRMADVEGFFNRAGFDLIKNMGNNNYIIGVAQSNPNYEILLSNASVVKEV